jgi:hypothetical protein
MADVLLYGDTERNPAVLLDCRELGFLELLRAKLSYDEISLDLSSRAVKRTGLREAVVDFGFPLALADRLRSEGVELAIDDGTVIGARRRVKSAAELEGIRRAQTAGEASIARAAALLRQAEPVDGTLHLEGGPLPAGLPIEFPVLARPRRRAGGARAAGARRSRARHRRRLRDTDAVSLRAPAVAGQVPTIPCSSA